MTSSFAVFEDVIGGPMGKINASDKIMFENQKKRKCVNKRNFYIMLHLKDYLEIEFTAC